jgi:hypothetical protein
MAPENKERIKQVLTWLDDLANNASIHFDKKTKSLAEDANTIISGKLLEPAEDTQKFPISPELQNLREPGQPVVSVKNNPEPEKAP